MRRDDAREASSARIARSGDAADAGMVKDRAVDRNARKACKRRIERVRKRFLGFADKEKRLAVQYVARKPIGDRPLEDEIQVHAAPGVHDDVRIRDMASAHGVEDTSKDIAHQTALQSGLRAVAVDVEEQRVDLPRGFRKTAFACEAIMGNVIVCGGVESVRVEGAASEGNVFPNARFIGRYDIEAVSIVVKKDAEKRAPLAFNRRNSSTVLTRQRHGMTIPAQGKTFQGLRIGRLCIRLSIWMEKEAGALVRTGPE